MPAPARMSLTQLRQVLNARASLLSNFEVLGLLRELESAYLARTKAAVRVKKEEDAAGLTPVPRAYDPLGDVSENLRTVEVEVRVPAVFFTYGVHPSAGDTVPLRGLPAHPRAVTAGHRPACPCARPARAHQG